MLDQDGVKRYDDLLAVAARDEELDGFFDTEGSAFDPGIAQSGWSLRKFSELPVGGGLNAG